MNASLLHELAELGLCLVGIAAVGWWLTRARDTAARPPLPPPLRPYEPNDGRKIVGRIGPGGRA
jgi:hypothetical protein